MKMNNIETEIIRHFLIDLGLDEKSRETFLSKVICSGREGSAVGFMTEIENQGQSKVNEDNKSYRWGKLGAKLNCSIDSGYVVYVDNGYIAAIEGYTYDDDWPQDIFEIDTYTIR